MDGLDQLSERRDVATLGGGCFWCLEAVFLEVPGVKDVVPGYAGGHVPHPTYEQVCTGTTGHAEVVQITFDPALVSYGTLLDIFFRIHDPTTPDRQGADVGPQYRSIILYHTPEQRETAHRVIRRLEDAGVWTGIVTEVVPFKAFYPAEEYHHRYYERHPFQPYCRLVIAPKLARFRQMQLRGRQRRLSLSAWNFRRAMAIDSNCRQRPPVVKTISNVFGGKVGVSPSRSMPERGPTPRLPAEKRPQTA